MEPSVNYLLNFALEPKVLEKEESNLGNRPSIYGVNEYHKTNQKNSQNDYFGVEGVGPKLCAIIFILKHFEIDTLIHNPLYGTGIDTTQDKLCCIFYDKIHVQFYIFVKCSEYILCSEGSEGYQSSYSILF